jgi:uncharacterized protein (TIGR02996 family)
MTTNDERVLLKAVIDNPDDDAPRLAYADWCDRRGDPRGRFIRVQVELAKVEFDLESPKRQPLEDESMTLLEEHEREWMPTSKSYILASKMHRGFVAGITISATSFLNYFTELSALYPIQLVTVRNLVQHARAVLTSPHLRMLSSLSVNRGNITDDDLEEFSQSQFAANLWWLDLSMNQISQKGVEALITSPCLKKLSFVWLDGNPCNPVENAGFDQGCLVDIQMPEAGRKLEARFGPIKWLKYRDIPSPFEPVDKR